MKFKKRVPLFFLTMAVFLGACGNSQETDRSEGLSGIQDSAEETRTAGKTETLVWRMKLPVGMEETETACELVEIWQEPLNALLQKKDAGYQIKMEILDLREEFAASDTSVADELQSLKKAAEQTDLISVRAPEQYENLEGYYLMYPECAKRGLFLPLGPLLGSERGKALKGAVTQSDLKRAEWDGQIFGISAVLPSSGYVVYSKEQMKKYGVSEEELLAPLFENEALMQKILDLSGEAPYGILSGDVRYELGLWLAEPCESLVLKKDGTFGIVTETPEYKERLAKLLEWKKKGLLKIVRGPQEDMCFAQQGNAAGMYFSDQAYSGELPVSVGMGEDRRYPVYLVPNQTECALAPYWGDAKHCIASWTKKQELAEDFLVRLMTDPDIANLMQYGREGQEYTLEDGKAQVSQKANIYLQLFGGQYTNPLITQPTDRTAEKKRDYAARFHEEWEPEIPDGFRFDPVPVMEQIVKSNQVFRGTGAAGKIAGLTFEDVDKAVAEITAELRAAGMDDVVEEANRQLREWKAGIQ